MKILMFLAEIFLKEMDDLSRVFLTLGREQQHDIVTTDFKGYLMCQYCDLHNCLAKCVHSNHGVLKFQCDESVLL